MLVENPLNNTLLLKRINYHSRLRRLVSYMEQHLDQPIDLQQAAQIVCMEKTAFSKYFSRAVGVTFHEFVQQWRIAAAVREMLVSDRSLSDLAFLVGFQNINTFGRTFKKVTTITPSDYRKRLLIKEQIIDQKALSKSQFFNKTQKSVRRSRPGF